MKLVCLEYIKNATKMFNDYSLNEQSWIQYRNN